MRSGEFPRAAPRGGWLSTVHDAMEQSREAFAVSADLPGHQPSAPDLTEDQVSWPRNRR